MRAILIGATGLTGGLLLQLLLNDNRYTQVQLIARRSAGIQHPKIIETILSFDDEAAFKNAVKDAEVLFCCVGTTQQKEKGNQASYRKVDYDIPVNAARYFAAQCKGSFIMISSVGAKADSGNFYLRLKGETETAVLQQSIKSIYIMRPSLLLGSRTDKRVAEKLGQVIMPLLSFFLAGSLAKYKAIEAATVAKAMQNAAANPSAGKFICEYREIMELVNQR